MTKIDNSKAIILNTIKSAVSYTQKEIEYLLSLAENKFEYDYIIDRLYLMQSDKNKRNTKNKFEYNFLTARQMLYRRNKEISLEKLQ